MFLELFVELMRNAYVTKKQTSKYRHTLTDLKEHVEHTDRTCDGRADLGRNSHPSPSSKHQISNRLESNIKHPIIQQKVEDVTIRLSTSSFGPVSLRYETSKGHTPTKLATTSISFGMARLLLSSRMVLFKA